MPKNDSNVKERLAIVETKVDKLQEEFDNFRANEFSHLRNKVDWIIGGVILNILIQILLKTF